MRVDLQGLSITKGELKRLSGVSIDRVLRPSTRLKFMTEIAKTGGVTVLVVLSCLMQSLIFPQRTGIVITVHIGIILGLIIEDVIKINFARNHLNLINLFTEVERYNTIIQAIDINDQIEEAGNPDAKVQDREKILEALRLTREDLVRALKTERILRKNQLFLAQNPELFANNLNALTALQVSDMASEHGRLLNEALQIAVSAQKEMKKLQDGKF